MFATFALQIDVLAVHISRLSFYCVQFVLLSIRFVSVLRRCNFPSQGSVKHRSTSLSNCFKNQLPLCLHTARFHGEKNAKLLKYKRFWRHLPLFFWKQLREKCWVSKVALLCTWPMIDEKLSGSFALISSGVNPVKSFPAESVIKETCFPLKETFQAQGL